MASPWDRLGRVASVMQLTGVDAMGLVSMIVQAAHIARRNREQCQQLAQHVQIVGSLLRKLQIPELRRHPETRLPLDQLNDALLRAFMLVRSCSQQQEKTSRVYQMLTGDDVANKLRRAQEEIDRYITLIPMITTVAAICARGTHQESAQDDTADDATLAQRPSLSLQEVTELLALEEPPPTGTLAVNQPPTFVLGDIVKDLLSRPGRSNIWFGPARTIMRLTEIGATHKRDSLKVQHVSGQPLLSDSVKEFTLAQLEAATKGFAAEAKIGKGIFGTVYRGKLADGREVAIKRGESGPRARRFQEKDSAFRSELAFLSRLHHRHLVGLVGYCEENDERLLVYSYMKNGALYDHLHPKSASAAPSPVASSWKLRIKILLHASRGIEYLHSYAMPPIIHGDIKSSNILLDGGWTAGVSDFGLSLMGPLEPSSEDDDGATATATATTARSRSRSQSQHLTVMKAAGTVGYMDPEYHGLHHLTVKSDVYGFGVVMLESLTGRRAIFKEAEGGSPVSVVDYAVPSIVSGELAKVLDPRAPEPAAHEAEAVELVANTAVHCVRLEGKDRPAMAVIVANLETACALCEGSAGDRGGGGGGFGNSSSSASLSVTSMDRSGALV